MAFLLWLGYFHRVRGAAERHVRQAAAGRSLRLWAYAHVAMYLGVSALASGSVAFAAHPQAHGIEPWIFASGLSLALLGLSLIGASHGSGLARSLRTAWPLFLLALATAGLPLVHAGLRGRGIVSACTLAAALQALLAARRRRSDPQPA